MISYRCIRLNCHLNTLMNEAVCSTYINTYACMTYILSCMSTDEQYESLFK